MAREKYKVYVKFIFSGYFEVSAESTIEAVEFIDKHCGLVLGGGVESTLPDDDIDWDFNVHPEKKITRVRKA